MSSEDEYTNGHTNGDSDYEEEEYAPKKNRKRAQESDDDFNPSPKKKKKSEKKKKKDKSQKKLKVKEEVDSGYQEKKTSSKKSRKSDVEIKAEVKTPTKRSKKEKKEEPERWKWWEQDSAKQLPKGHNWGFMQHNGPIFAPPYEPLPEDVNFYYNGNAFRLSDEAEEVMTFYAKMLDHDYTTKEAFNSNFMQDWKSCMTHEEKMTITKLSKCDFSEVAQYFKQQSEIRKARSKEEKKAETDEKKKLVDKYGWCSWDGHNEKIGNCFIEPPGLFRGRGEHPKMGKLKKRVRANQVIINCSKDAKFPEPPPGEKWKEIRHDPTVSWLATWTENVQGQNKYVMLNANSKIKGEKDLAKYEKARKLHQIIKTIREDYKNDWKSKEMSVRQRAVAIYFIDKLALRAGNEKDTEEAADTCGCCSLRVEHITLHDKAEVNGAEAEYVVEFDFLGKDSMRYHNMVAVEKRVYKNLGIFMENKDGADDLFDRVNTSKLNDYLNGIMDGLTAKVFRTYNASITLQRQLKRLAKEGEDDESIAGRVLQYNRANRDVAILCNHQRAAPKTFDTQMERMDEKIKAKEDAIKEKKREVKQAKAAYKSEGGEKAKKNFEQKKKQLIRLDEQWEKLTLQKIDKDENKTIALGTSKLNYLDPRISVAWCKKHNVPVEKVYNKTQRDKFQWAIDMVMLTDEEFVF